MSPEQAMGEDVDGRADTYAVGVVLYEMLTGRLPFEGRNITELMAKIISAPPPKVSAAMPQTPAALVELVKRLLAKERDQRPDAAELVKLLAAARTPDALLTPSQATWRKRKRRLLVVGVGVGSAAIVLYLVGKLAILAGRLVFQDPGEDPTIYADSTSIPATLKQAARDEGSLLPGEHLRFAFIPGGRTMDDALFVADSFVVRRSPAGARRVLLKGANVNVNRAKRPGEPRLKGYLIISRGRTTADTLYNDLGGLDVARLLITMYAHRKEIKGDKP
jgi:hypothetical protein